MSVQIIRAGQDDWPLVRAVRLQSLEADPSAFGSTLPRELTFTEDEWRRRIGSAAWLLAISADDTAGDGPRTVGVGQLRPLSGENADSEINAMWVAPQARGLGVGRQLLTGLVDVARAAGYQSVRLWVTAGNLGATALYEHFGFVATGTTEPLLSDPRLTVAEYVLALP